MPRAERIVLTMATLFCLTFVSFWRDSAPPFVSMTRLATPPVPPSITDRSGSVLVSVEDEAGVRIAGALVRVLSLQDERAYLAGAGRTDALGAVAVESLPLGETWILAEAEGRARASTRLVVSSTQREVKLKLRPSVVLHVAVFDDAGGPIADASVEVRTGDPLPFLARTNTAGEATVDRLGPPAWTIKVTAAGFEAVTQSMTQVSSAPLPVTLRRLGFFDVITVDADGRALGDVTILVAGSGLWPAQKTRSGLDGHAKIADLPRGIYDFRATRGDLVSPAEMGVALGRGESKSITLALAPGRRVAVRVTDGDDEDAAPIAGASLVLAEGGISSFPLEAKTDAQGTASLGPIAPGDAFVSARAPGFVTQTGVIVPPGAAPALLVQLLRGATLRGDVVDTRGFPVDGASIEVVGTMPSGEPIDESPERMAFSAAHFSWALGGAHDLAPAGELGVMPGKIPGIPRAGALPPGLLRGSGTEAPPEPWVTRDDGTFRAFPIPPGRVRAIVRHPSYIEGLSEVVSLSPAGEATVHVVLSAGATLEGRVVDDRKIPASGVRVDIAASKGSLERTTVTADDGTFGFAAVPAEVVVSVSRPDAVDEVAVRTTVTLKDGEKTEVEIVLPAPRDAMTVTVVNDRGDPMDGAQVLLVSLTPDAPLRRTLFADRDGRVVFADAVGLAARLTVSRRGYAPVVQDLTAAPPEQRIELKAGIRVTGTITTRSGRDLLEGAEVTLYVGAGPLHARSDRVGVYGFADVPSGLFRVTVTHPGYAKLEQTTKIEAPAEVDRPVTLDPQNLEPGGSVEGDVIDAHGDPVAGARVAETSVSTYLPAGHLPPGVALTNRRGEFKLDDLDEGDLVLEAYAPESGRGRSSGVRVTAGRTTRGVRIALSGTDKTPPLDSMASGGVAMTLDDSSRVVGVSSGSEAERAGLQTGDHILAIDGHPVASTHDAENRLFGPLADDLVVELMRGDQKLTLRIPRERVHR